MIKVKFVRPCDAKYRLINWTEGARIAAQVVRRTTTHEQCCYKNTLTIFHQPTLPWGR